MSCARVATSPERRMDDGTERGRAIGIVVDGNPVRAYEGESVATALLATGQRTLRTTSRRGAPRGLYCGIGSCFECVMVIDGRPGIRACQTPVREGMHIETQQGEGEWAFTAPSRSSSRTAPPAPAVSPATRNGPHLDPDAPCGCGT
jgi:hypothetical protein